MAAWKVRKFSSSVEKYFVSERRERVKYFPTPSGHVMFLRTGFCELLCSHSNGEIFTSEDIMFSRENSPGISLVFI